MISYSIVFQKQCELFIIKLILMKKTLLIFLSLLLVSSALTQIPNKMSFQTVVRNSQGKLMVNNLVGVRFSVLQGSATGSSVYVETHQKSTNANGLITLQIGTGLVNQGVFSSINWAMGPYFLKTELDVNGATNYTINGTTEFESVPFAFHANTVKTLTNGVNLGDMNYWNGSSWVPLSAGSQGQTLTFCDGKPTWTVGGICPGVVSSIDCSNATHVGILTASSQVTNATSTLPYSGGNGGPFVTQAFASKGVLGLTATLSSGNFSMGSGTLTFTITGTPTSSGTASFDLTIGGKTCTLTRIVASSTQQNVGSYGANVVDVDGNSYKTVLLGTQQWMAENLKVTKFNDGTLLPVITSSSLWSTNTTGANCYLNNDLATVTKYGRLYNWNAVSRLKNGNKNICPTGWHVPASTEWITLFDYLGGITVAGGKMKEVGTLNWTSPNTDATNVSLFTALPGGARMYDIGDYYYYTGSGYWWTSTESNSLEAWRISLNNNSASVDRAVSEKASGFSIRCIKD